MKQTTAIENRQPRRKCAAASRPRQTGQYWMIGADRPWCVRFSTRSPCRKQRAVDPGERIVGLTHDVGAHSPRQQVFHRLPPERNARRARVSSSISRSRSASSAPTASRTKRLGGAPDARAVRHNQLDSSSPGRSLGRTGHSVARCGAGRTAISSPGPNTDDASNRSAVFRAGEAGMSRWWTARDPARVPRSAMAD